MPLVVHIPRRPDRRGRSYPHGGRPSCNEARARSERCCRPAKCKTNGQICSRSNRNRTRHRFVGELLGVESALWSFHLQSFVDGDVHTLIAFIDRYGQTAAMDRYVLVDSLGDGRALNNPPSMTKEKTGGYLVRCPVLPSAERIAAADLPSSWTLSDRHDIMLKNGNWAMVSGLDALPQQVKTCLSHQKGESPFHRDFGTRFAEYYRLLSGSPWFEQFLKLEIIRQAAVPYFDAVHNRQYTPLLCVERVFGIRISRGSSHEQLAADSNRPRD